MKEAALKHIDILSRHGAYILTAGGKELVSRGFYYSIVNFCEQHRINCIGYEMHLPDTEEPMMLAIWRDGHIDSGSKESVEICMNQY